MFDIALLKENIEIPLVLDALGLDYKSKSRRFWILCPFHNDNKIGSAYLTDNGYFCCHSCGTKSDIFDLVMKINNCDFRNASIFISELFGGADRYGIDENEVSSVLKEYRNYKLSSNELKTLNFPDNITVQLKAFYFFDAAMYKKLITEKAKEMLARYNTLLTNCGKRDAKEAYKVYQLGMTNANAYTAIANEIKTRIAVCEEIIERLA